MATTKDHYFSEFFLVSYWCRYVENYREKTDQTDRGIKIFLAVAASASIGAWTIWRELGGLWGAIIAASQVVAAANPYLPYRDRLRALATLSLTLEELAVTAESKWLDMSSDQLPDAEIRKALGDLRIKKVRALHKAGVLPKDAAVAAKAEEENNVRFRHFYPEGYREPNDVPAK